MFQEGQDFTTARVKKLFNWLKWLGKWTGNNSFIDSLSKFQSDIEVSWNFGLNELQARGLVSEGAVEFMVSTF